MSAAEYVECPSCGDQYKHLATHWNGKSCDPPTLTQKQIELITGAFMGDGSIVGPQNSRQFNLSNTNRTFLEWFDQEMGVLTTGVKAGMTPEQHARAQERSKGGSYDAENYQTTYYLHSRSIEIVDALDDWYKDNRKHIPNSLTLTPTITKMWYVTDGTLVEKDGERPYIRIADTNEITHNERSGFVISLFEEKGFNATTTSHSIKIYKDSSEVLFEWMGAPPPGFEHKWT